MIQIPCTSRTRETTSWGVLRNCTRTSFFRRAISGFTWLTNGSHWCWTYILSHYYGWANDTPEYMICGSHWCWTHILSHYYGWANDIWYVDPIGVAHIYYPTTTGGKMIHDMWIPLVLHIYIIPLLRVGKWYMICGSHWCCTYILSHYYWWINDMWYVDPIGVADTAYIIPLLRVGNWYMICGSHWCCTCILSHYHGWANDTWYVDPTGCCTYILSHYYGWANDVWYT